MTHTRKHLLRLTLVIGVGLLSRRMAIVPLWIGDMLWAVAVYESLCLLLQRERQSRLYLTALCLAYIIECSQLIQWHWLVQVRHTTIGHLLLGQGFLWSDLLAYTVGILLLAIIDFLLLSHKE